MGTNTLAGSCTNLNITLKILVDKLRVPLQDAVGMISANPARVTRIDNEVGTLQAGLKADLVLMKQNFDIKKTIVCGKIAYEEWVISQRNKDIINCWNQVTIMIIRSPAVHWTTGRRFRVQQIKKNYCRIPEGQVRIAGKCYSIVWNDFKFKRWYLNASFRNINRHKVVRLMT